MIATPEHAFPTALTPTVLHILVELAGGPQHGYAIMRAVGRAAQGDIRAGPSTIYGCLTRMEANGLVRQEASRSMGARGKPRRSYALTARGRLALEAECARLVRTMRLLRVRGLIPDPKEEQR